MKSLTSYFIAIATILLVLLCIGYFTGNGVRFKAIAIFVAGYAIGMLAMYIKMKWFLQ